MCGSLGDETEGDLESRIRQAFRRAFPTYSPTALRFQTTLRFRLGHATFSVDGKEVSRVWGRIDVLLLDGEAPIAVLELKRPGHGINDDDAEQGLSYARALDPRPPLVILSDEDDVRILATHSGDTWVPRTNMEEDFQRLAEAAATIAGQDIDSAIRTLLGGKSAVWTSAVRAGTEVTISQRTGELAEFTKPFAEKLMLPRKAAHEIVRLIQADKKVIILQGSPLVGKSNVLRSVVQQFENSSHVPLLIDASGGRFGIFRRLANLLSTAFGWHIVEEEARAWVQTLSRTETDYKLVILIDNVNSRAATIISDIEELAAIANSSRLCLVIAADGATAEGLARSADDRNASTIGLIASRVFVADLDDEEFANATEAFQAKRIAFASGAQLAPEYRVPWVLRLALASVDDALASLPATTGITFPPLLGPDLLIAARHFSVISGVGGPAPAIAEAAILDYAEARPPILELASRDTFMLRREAMTAAVGDVATRELEESGIIARARLTDGTQLLVPTIQPVVAAEAALALMRRATDDGELNSFNVRELVVLGSRLPLGDVITAQAFLDVSHYWGGISRTVFDLLLAIRPEKKIPEAGMRALTYIPDKGPVKLSFRGDESLEGTGYVNFLINERPTLYSNTEAWLVLSHLLRYAIVSGDSLVEGTEYRGNLLAKVGSCPFILRRPVPGQELPVHGTESYEVLCGNIGMVEPITVSIALFIESSGDESYEWVERALIAGSMPLLTRIYAALTTFGESARRSLRIRARRLSKRVASALVEMADNS